MLFMRRAREVDARTQEREWEFDQEWVSKLEDAMQMMTNDGGGHL